MEYLLPNDQNGIFTSNLFRAVFILNKMEIKLINGHQNGIFTAKWPKWKFYFKFVSRRIRSEQNGNSTYKWSPKWKIYFQMAKMEILLQIWFRAVFIVVNKLEIKLINCH